MSSIPTLLRTNKKLRKQARHWYEKDRFSYAEIGKKVGCSSTTVSSIAREDGWKVLNKTITGQQLVKELNWSKKDKKTIITRYLDGEGMEEIASSFGLSSRGPIRRILKQNKIEIFHTTKFSKDDTKYIVSSYKDKISSAQLAREFEVDNCVIRRVLRESNVLLRSVSEANALRGIEKLSRSIHEDRKSFTFWVRNLTATMYSHYKHVINPLDLERSQEGFSLDHRYSIHDAIYNPKNISNPINIYELCHPANLEIIGFLENSIKNYKSSVSAKQLRKDIESWNLVYGCPYFCSGLPKVALVMEVFGRYDNYGIELREAVGSYYQTSERV